VRLCERMGATSSALGLRISAGFPASVVAMSVQPVYPHEPAGLRVPRTIGGISDALRGSRRAQFFAELLKAEQGGELDALLTAWWGRAMLDSDPDRDRIHAAAEAGTLPTSTVDEVRHRRLQRGTE
jgi:hypothetical protein